MPRASLSPYQDLLRDSVELLDSFPLRKLSASGIVKDREMKASSAINVTYPPLKALPQVEGKMIFPDRENLKREISLYINLPFCTGKCIYCGFKIYANQDAGAVDRYLNALKKELGILFDKRELKDSVLKSVYIGGGTPTYLSTSQLESLLCFLNKKFPLQGLEFTVESSPETLSKEKIDLMLKHNVNRLSIGVQSFDDNTLKAINRRHDSRQAIDAFETARKRGFSNINIDLIRGLPHYSEEKIYSDLKAIEKLMPPSVTNYHLSVKPESALKVQYAENPEILPGEKKALLLHLMFLKGMGQLGYKQEPVDWFALKADYDYKQQRQKWFQNTDLLGVGTCAYSYFNGWQYYNCFDLNQYLPALESGKLPISRGFSLDEKEKEHRKVIFGLKYSIENKKYNKEISAKIRQLKKLGLLESNGKIKLSLLGTLFADEVCRQFYSEKVKQHDKTNAPL